MRETLEFIYRWGMTIGLGLMALGYALGCGDSMVSPDPPSTTTTTVEPRVDQPFSWEAYQGIIAFGLGHPGQSDTDVLRFVSAAMPHGWNTFQICSETEFWDGPGYPTKPRDPARLEWTLDLIARVPGAQVALIGNCTLKRQIPLGEQMRVGGVSAQEIVAWHRSVATIAVKFRNVAIFTHNEFDNCRGRSDWGGRPENCAGKNDVAQHIRDYRAAGVLEVTADDSFSYPRPGDSPSHTYGFRLANIGARPASFHPDRTKNGEPWDPSLHQLQQLARYNGLFVLSETVAYNGSGNRCDGLRTCSQERINDYIARCSAVPECRFTYHCATDGGGDCLAGEVPPWIPEAR